MWVWAFLVPFFFLFVALRSFKKIFQYEILVRESCMRQNVNINNGKVFPSYCGGRRRLLCVWLSIAVKRYHQISKVLAGQNSDWKLWIVTDVAFSNAESDVDPTASASVYWRRSVLSFVSLSYHEKDGREKKWKSVTSMGLFNLVAFYQIFFLSYLILVSLINLITTCHQ